MAVTLNGDLSLDNDAKIASDGSSSDTLTANGDVALGASTLTLAPGFATPSIIWTFNGVISGSGGLAITAPVLTSGFFRVTLANANTYSGNTTITAPASATGGTRLGLNHVNAIQNSTYDTGAAAANVTTLFLIAGNNTYNFGGLKGANALAVSGNTLNIGGNNASTIYSGAITGNGGLIKSGSGTLTLSGANAYSGGTLVSNGVLKVDASGAIGTGDLSIASGATCGIGNSAAMAVSAAVYLSGVLDLTNGVNLTVQRLYINGQLQSAGNWNAARDPAHFSGSGNLTVTDGLPAAPSALAATSISSSQINLSWIDNADNEGGFEIQRSLTSGSGYVQIATVGANAAAYSDTGLNAETLYFYRVRATNYFAGSDFSSESSATTLPNPPSAPTGLAAVGGAGEIDLSWAAAAGASSYNVKRGASSGGPYTLVVSNVNPTAYSDVNVANGTTYYYVVSGVNAGGEGGNSAEVSAMPSSAGSYTNISNGAWSTVVWQPMMTAPGLQTTNVFRNSAAVSSTNDLGDFTLNQLRFDDQAVALSGDPLTFDGVGPALIAAPDQAHSIANDLNLNQDTRFSIAQNATTVNGAINGVGALVKSGAGALNLTASNSYSGGTVIADGVLGITSDNQLGLAGSAVTFTNGGRLRITSSSVTLNDRALELQSGGGGISNTTAVILNTAVSGPGSLTKTGAGKLTLSAASTYSGGTTIGSGTLYVTGGSVLGTGPVTIPTGGMLEHNASGTMANDLTLSTSNGSRGFGGITISGSSTRTFSGAVTLGANANISGGNTANAVTWSGAFDLGAFTLTVNPNCATAVQSWAIDGAVTGTGGLTLAAPGLTSGTLTLRLGGANTYSGETLLSAQSGATGAARLALANVAALQNSTLNTGAAGGAQEVTFAVSGFNTYALGGLTGADALDLGGNSIDVGANGSTTTYSGEISGAGGFTKSGTGTLTLSGVNTFSGGTLVSGGTLLVDATGALGSGDLTVSAGANCTIQNGTALATNATVSLVGVMAVDNGVALTVQKLYLNGQLQSPGIWNAARDATHFAGGGDLMVTDGLPAVPNGLSATAGDAQVALNWSAAAGAVSYNVKRSTASGGPYTTITNVTSPAFTDTGLANGTDYYYVVSGSNANGESANSAQVVATPIAPPVAPIGVIAEAGDADVTLSWNTSSGATSYNVKRSNLDGGPYTTITNVTGSGCVDAGLTNETEYFYVITALNAAGESGNSAQVSATPTSLPSPWLSQDIGSTGATGSASYSNGVFTVKGAGALIGSRADAFRFVYQSSSGDCTNVVRVTSVQNTASAARAGVMIRDSLNADAMEAGVWVTPGNGITFSWRKTTGGTTSSTSSSGKTAPYWVKLTRTGNSFRAYYSANGTSWTQFGSTQTISMGSAAYIGMGVTSGAAGTLCTSTIDNVATQP
ncbi:MAG: autotransporter-associated beta strand repeat-containing protein [Verrucomicrobiota bacterium]